MSRLLQRLQRRAIVALAWLVLALAVAPVAAESMRPLAVFAATATSLSVAAELQSRAPSTRGRGMPAGSAHASSARASRAAAVSSARTRLAVDRAIDRARPTPSAVDRLPPPLACRAGTRDERRLYLSLCRLSC